MKYIFFDWRFPIYHFWNNKANMNKIAGLHRERGKSSLINYMHYTHISQQKFSKWLPRELFYFDEWKALIKGRKI